MNVLILSGSRNPQGQTARACTALQQGLADHGANTELIFLPARKIERCRQCDDQGWGLCRREGRCTITDDDFASLFEQVQAADLLVFGTPVYYGDLAESLRALLERMRRVCWHMDNKNGLAGKPAVGVCVAGGGGGGSYSCCVSLERMLTTCGLNVLDLIPVRRQNLEMKAAILRTAGAWLADPDVRRDRPQA